MANRFIPVALVVITVAAMICGCGGGGSSATSGTLEGFIYIPDNSRASGETRADAPDGYSALSGATVDVTSGVRTFQATTDANGHFSITGVPVGNASVRITPPNGSSYRVLNTSVNVSGGSNTMVGEDGKVSLLASSAASLSMEIVEVDLSAWPMVKLHIDVNDPDQGTRLMGLKPSDFDVSFNNVNINIEQVQVENTYVLTCHAKDAVIEQFSLNIGSSFCGVNGSVNSIITRQPQHFLSPVGSTNLTYDFKDAAYTAIHPGMWHMGVDYNANAGSPVYAIASGEVMRRVTSGTVTGLVIKHHTLEDIATSSGATKTFYAVYGYINPTVANGATVTEGQQIGTVAFWNQGNHLHLGIRVGQDITGEWRMSSFVGGQVPAADSHGLTNGWADPVAFYQQYNSDNSQ